MSRLGGTRDEERDPRDPRGDDLDDAFAWPWKRAAGEEDRVEEPVPRPQRRRERRPRPATSPAWARARHAFRRPLATPRRRRATTAAALLVVGAAGIGLAALLSPDEGERRDRALLEAAAPGSGRSPRDAVPVPAAVRRAAARLSLERQVAQLFVVDVTGQYPRDPFLADLRRRGWGAVVVGPANFVDEGQLAALTGEIDVVARQARAPVPLVVANQSGGRASAFPNLPPTSQPRIGRTGRPSVARRQARAAAAALRQLGITMNLAPVADVGAPAGPVEDRVFSDDPAVVTAMVRAAVDGYRAGGVIPAVGHFPGIGAASADPDSATATVGLSLDDLRRRDLRPFAAVARSAPVIVVSNAVYAAFDGVTPAVLEPGITAGLLRRDLRFRGVMMTDDLTATAAILAKRVDNTAVAALAAGADLLYVSGGGREQELAYRAVLRAVRRGVISRERVRLSVLRVLALKRRYGLLPTPPPGRAARESHRRPAPGSATRPPVPRHVP